MNLIVIFSRRSEFDKARAALTILHLPHEVVSPDPGLSLVGAPALICDEQALAAIQEQGIVCAGWADYRRSETEILPQAPQSFREDVFGKAAIMFFGPCMADPVRVRLIAHLSGDLTAVLPHVNTAMPQACFNAGPSTLTYMDERRLVTVYPRRIAIGKARDLVDGWRTLENIRLLVNGIWERRAEIPPSYEMHAKPTVLQMYARLPRTNCKACGEPTCMAFAVKLWNGTADISQCERERSRNGGTIPAPPER